ncbi:MAG: helix-turn-helix domain-containing protein [Candidatus Acidiferrum sp.]
MPRKTRTVEAPIQSGSNYVSVEKAAELLCVSKVTIRRYLGLGRLTKFKVGSRTLLKYENVMSLVREVPATEVATAK